MTAAAEDGVAVTLTVAAPLWAAVSTVQIEAARHVDCQLTELMADLGIPGRTVTRIAADGGVGGETSDGELFRLTVARQRCRFPRTTIPEIVAYLSGTSEIPTPDAALAVLAGSNAADRMLPAFVGLLCRAAVSDQPDVLLHSSASQRILDDLGLTDVAAPDVITAALRATVALGIPLGARAVFHEALSTDVPALEVAEHLIAALAPAVLELQLEPGYLRTVTSDPATPGHIKSLRDDLFLELGWLLPSVRFRPDPLLRDRAFAVKINGVRLLPHIGLAEGELLVNESPAALAGVVSEARETRHPVTGFPAALVSARFGPALQDAGFLIWSGGEFLTLSLLGVLRLRAHLCITLDTVASMFTHISWLPALTEASDGLLGRTTVTAVVRGLVSEGVPVRHVSRILELLLRFATAEDSTAVDQMSFIRSGMSDIIATTFSRGSTTLPAYLLDAAFERVLDRFAQLPAPEADHAVTALLTSIQEELALAPRHHPPVILTVDRHRAKVRQLLRHQLPSVQVLAFGDIPRTYDVQPQARITPAFPTST